MERTANKRKASSKQRKLKTAHRRTHRSTTSYGGFCCSCRLSISSPEETESDNSEKPGYLSTIVHTMVQERLEKLIKKMTRQTEVKEKDVTNFKLCKDSRVKRLALAVQKVSLDPREDLRESMLEMIRANEMKQPSELRRLLESYLSLNSEGCAGLILDVFHEVCSLIYVDSSSSLGWSYVNSH